MRDPPAPSPAAQAARDLLHASGLPTRWAGRAHCTLLQTGFDSGHLFLATWQAWRADPQRCTRLHVVALASAAPTRAALAAAHALTPAPLQDLAIALLAAWPPLTPDLHLLDFDGGRVQLLLAVGTAAHGVSALQAQVDVFHLVEGPAAAPAAAWQPRQLQALARKAAAGATLASDTADLALQRGLRTAGFVMAQPMQDGNAAEAADAADAPNAPDAADAPGAPAASVARPCGIQARYAPAFVPRRAGSAGSTGSGLAAGRPGPRDAVVVGGGIAGAAVAQALALQGVSVTVVDRHALPAQETSGNPAGLFHGTVHAGDGRYARLFRAAALHAQQVYAEACAHGVPGSAAGLLRLASPHDTLPAMQQLLQQLGLPADHVAAVDAATASQLAGVSVQVPAWLYAGGGWVAPAAWVGHALDRPGIRFVGGCAIGALRRDGDHWLLCDADDQVVARTATVVLANAASAAALLVTLGHAPWPCHQTRGQVSVWRGAGTSLRMPLAGDGYAVPLRRGALLFGATRAPADIDAPDQPRTPADPLPHTRACHADHLQNIARLRRLTGLAAPADDGALQGRSGWRLHADDQLPIAGALPLAALPIGLRLDQARLLPRERGLFVLTALGSRGLTLAPLLGRLVAAQVCGTPWPLQQDLADAVDPARWLVRAARQAQAAQAPGPRRAEPEAQG